MGSRAAAHSAELAYGREDEMQADQFGVEFIVGAGYSPEGLLKILKKIRAKTWFGSDQIPTYLKTHPAVEDRIAFIGSWLENHDANAKPIALVKQDTFDRIHTRVETRYGDEATVMSKLKADVAKNPDDPLAPLLAAHLDWEDGDLSAAKRNLAAALLRTPEFVLPHYLLGLLLLDDPSIPFRIDMVRSRKHLQRALHLCPDMLLARFRLALLDMEEGKHLEALAALQELKAKRPGIFIWSFFQGRISTN